MTLASPAISLLGMPSSAQIVPDETLGVESSQVLTEVEVKGGRAELIRGGASRGANLFHSFTDFNVADLQRVYFANPAGIDSILSRVTGPDASNIFGTLGVNGTADLFFINPNGIVFGENAVLDIEGSFYGTAGEAIALGQSVFSATQPEQSSLVSVRPDVLFESYLSEAAGDITSRGQLAATGNLVLAAHQLDLQGQLASGNDLELLAFNDFEVRDTVAAPFIASAGGELLIQGNEQINIFALNHPDSVLYSAGDMTLRSDNTVSGDAHYWSNGNFRIENLSGELAGLSSPNDPIVRSAGNVFIGDYIGNSLHIIAAGAVSISGNIRITGADDTGASIQEIVTLSNGETVSVDGSRVATLDIRAGVSPTKIGTPLGLVGNGSFPTGGRNDDFPFSASILIGNIILEQPNGLVLLTNQYFPNEALTPSDIIIFGQNVSGEDATLPVSGIDTSGLNDLGGRVFIDSRGGILLDDNVKITTDSAFEDADNIDLLAEGSIILNPNAALSANSETAKGGNIHLSAGGSILLGESTTIRTDSALGDAGNVDLLAEGDILLELGASIGTRSETAKAGNIHLSADEIELSSTNFVTTSGAGGNILIEGNRLSLQFLSFILSSASGAENGGNVSILVNESIEVVGGGIGTQNTSNSAGDSGNVLIRTSTLNLQGSRALLLEGVPPGGDISSDISGTGDAGDILIEADQVSISDGGQIRADLLNTDSVAEPAQGGDITLIVSDYLEVAGFIEGDNNISKISTNARPETDGNGGSIRIEAGNVLIRDGAQIQAGNFGSGKGGNISIDTTDFIILFDYITDDLTTGVFTGPEGATATGNSGNINIKSDLTAVLGPEAEISNEVDVDAAGNAGNITIDTRQLSVGDGASITSESIGAGRGGNLQITASERIDVFGSDLSLGVPEAPSQITVSSLGLNDAGSLEIDTGKLTVTAGGSVSASNLGAERGGITRSGDITISAADFVLVDGESSGRGFASSITSEAGGFPEIPDIKNSESLAVGGNILIDSPLLLVQNGGEVSAQTFGEGDAGSIEFTGDRLLMNNARLSTSTEGSGKAGNLVINANESIEIAGDRNQSDSARLPGLFAQTLPLASGSGGDINLSTQRLRVEDGGSISAVAEGTGNAGNISIDFSDTMLLNNSRITTSAPRSSGGNISVNAGATLGPGLISLISSDITTDSDGDGGNIDLNSLTIAFDDSDIIARSESRRGGNITFGPFFSQTLPPDTSEPFDGDGQVDINADGLIAAGQIFTPDTSFIENSLSELSETLVSTESLTVGSCIDRSQGVAENQSQGNSFVVTGREATPQQPGSSSLSVYSTRSVQATSEVGQTIQEPQAAYQLADGRWVLSHDCQP